MARKQKYEARSEAALEKFEIKKKQLEAERLEQERKEKLIAQTHELIGRIQVADLVEKFGNVSRLVWLKQVKDSKIYKEIPWIGSWETFCNYLGKSRRTIDEQLQNLNAFGEEFLATVTGFSLGYRHLRKLRKAVTDGQVGFL